MEQLITSDFKLGIIAGGQLSKMLTLAASNWDIQTYVLDPSPTCPSANTCTQFVEGDYTSFDSVYNFGKNLDMITLEIENVNADALIKLKQEGKRVYPDPETLKVIQDKGLQKQFYSEHNIASSSFDLFETTEDLLEAVRDDKLSIPFVQKSRRAGYDGRGVHIVKELLDLEQLLPGPSMVEMYVKVQCELAVIVVRNTRGEVKAFPPVEMEFNQDANLVEFLTSPASVTDEIKSKATQMAKDVIEAYDLVGILAVEMFLDEEMNLLINEVAPRPHNSGHHTIESNFTSQYEQHLRAIFGFPLGSTEMKLPSVMINILGSPGYEGSVKYEGLTKCMAVEGIKLHIYGKAITKPYRKMGHATILDHDIHSAKEKAKFIQQNIKVIA